MAGGRWRRSGEGDHKGRPYESFDSGNAVGAADGQSLPGFSRDHAVRPGGATSSRPLEGRFLAALSDQSPMTVGAPLVWVPCGVASFSG